VGGGSGKNPDTRRKRLRAIGFTFVVVQVTPLQALNLLGEWKKKLEE
jgi:hypothetical protein